MEDVIGRPQGQQAERVGPDPAEGAEAGVEEAEPQGEPPGARLRSRATGQRQPQQPRQEVQAVVDQVVGAPLRQLAGGPEERLQHQQRTEPPHVPQRHASRHDSHLLDSALCSAFRSRSTVSALGKCRRPSSPARPLIASPWIVAR